MPPLILATALSVLVLDAAPATAPPAPAPAAAVGSRKPADAPEPGKKVVCRAQVVTGSRFMRRICMTRAEWVDYDRLQQQEADDFKRRMNAVNGLPSMGGPGTPAAN